MSGIMLAIYVVVFGALFYFLLYLPQRRRRREQQELLTKLSPGDEVVTAAGIYGTVTEIEEGGTLLLEVAENTDIRVAKASIVRILRDEPGAAGSSAVSAAE